ncbi:MAG: hypothetical protein ABIL09_09670 [Gemmatimonadota bacterium]
MTRACIDCGGCGRAAAVKVAASGDGRVAVEIESDCPEAVELGRHLGAVDPYGEIGSLLQSATYRAAGQCLRHAGCVVPVAVIRAIEVEAGLALPNTASIAITKEET